MNHPVPKSMPKKEMAWLLRELREIRRTATMENASFYVFDKDEPAKMEQIRELTRSWRNSWLIGPLDRLIERYETRKVNK